MRTIEQKIYSFSDLQENEELKQKVLDKFRYSERNEVFGVDDMQESFKQIKKHVFEPLKEIDEEISGARLVAWINNNLSWRWEDANRISKHEGGRFKNSYFAYKYDKCLKYRVSNVFKTNNLENCPFTGVCYDFNFLEPIIKFLKNPSSKVSNLDLVDDIPSVNDVYNIDLEWIQSDEYILEHLESNDYEFDEFGNII